MKSGKLTTSIILLAFLLIGNGAAADNATAENLSITEDPVSWYERGKELYFQGQLEEALNALEKALELDPEYVDAWNGKGIVLDDLGRYEEAIEAYDKALALDPEFAYAWNNKGNALGNLGRYEEAIEAYDKALALDPEYADAWYNKGIALGNLDRYEEAIEAYEKALALDSGYVAAWNNKGNALYNLGQYEEAIEAYEKALALDPEYADAWYNKGNALVNLGRYEEAIEAYDKALALDPEYADAWNGKGVALDGLDRYEEAIEAYEKALALDPEYADAWSNKGEALYNLSRYEEALPLYENATELDPQFPEAWKGKGNCLKSLNRTSEASMAFARAREIEMKPETKATIFAAFLGFYIALLAFGYWRRERFTALGYILLENLLGFLAFGWILAGLFDPEPVALFLASGLILIGSTALIWALLGAPKISSAILAFERFEQEHTRLSRTIKRLSLAAMVIYPLLATLFYFRYGMNSEAITLTVFRASLAAILLASWLVTLPPTMEVLLSENLTKEARNLVVFFQFGYLSFNALFLSLILWILEIGGGIPILASGDVNLSISPEFLAVVMFLFVVMSLAPYRSGWERSKRWREEIFRREDGRLDDLLDILDFPTPGLYVQKLRKLLDKITADVEKSIGDQSEQKDDQKSALLLGYEDFLIRLQAKVEENFTQFEALDDEKEIIERAGIYAKAYRLRKDEIAKTMEKESVIRPQLWIVLAIILTPILGEVLRNLINWILVPLIKTQVVELLPAISQASSMAPFAVP